MKLMFNFYNKDIINALLEVLKKEHLIEKILRDKDSEKCHLEYIGDPVESVNLIIEK